MFAIPAILGLLALGAVPIIIHLIFRQRYRRIRWAAMDFLLAAIKRTRRRLRLENLLLLLLRILAIVLLVLACAVPTFSGKSGTLGRTGAKHTVLVVDTSASMGYLERGAGAVSAYGQAIEGMRDLIGTLQKGDALSVIAATDRALALTPGKPYSADQVASPAEIDRLLADARLSLSYRSSSLTPALEAALETLSASTKLHREVIILSDLQRSAWLGESESASEGAASATGSKLTGIMRDLAAATGGALTIIDVGTPNWSNLVVESLTLGSNVVSVDQPVELTVTVHNPGKLSQPGIGVELLVGGPGGTELATKSTRETGSFEAGDRAVVQFSHVFGEPGTYRIAARILGDNLTADNFRTLSIEVPQALDVLLVSGQTNQTLTWLSDELGFVHVILEPVADMGAFRVTHMDEASAYDLQDLSRFRSIILGNVMSLSAEMVSRLETWVERGGGLMVFTGDQTITSSAGGSGNEGTAFYGETLFAGGKGLLPARITGFETPADLERGSPELLVTPSARDHPALSSLVGAPDLFRAYVPRHVVLEPIPDRQDIHTLIQLTGDATRGRSAYPFLIEGLHGAGKVMLVATTADEEWNDLMQYPIYPVLVTELVGYLSSRPRPGANVQVGGELQARYSGTQIGEATLTLPQPALPGDLEGRATIPARITPASDRVDGPTTHGRFSHSGTEYPGFYVLATMPQGDGDPGLADSFAVNVKPTEGDMTRIEADELRGIAPDIDFRVTEDLTEVLPAEAAESEYPGWRIFLWILFFVLIAETVLARRFGDYEGRKRS